MPEEHRFSRRAPRGIAVEFPEQARDVRDVFRDIADVPARTFRLAVAA